MHQPAAASTRQLSTLTSGALSSATASGSGLGLAAGGDGDGVGVTAGAAGDGEGEGDGDGDGEAPGMATLSGSSWVPWKVMDQEESVAWYLPSFCISSSQVPAGFSPQQKTVRKGQSWKPAREES